MAFMMIFAGLATVLLVGAMALDRYFAIIHPFKYNAVDRNTIVKFVIFGIWFFSIFIALLPVVGLGEYVVHYPFSWCFFNFFGHKVEDQIYGYFYCVLGLGIICIRLIINQSRTVSKDKKADMLVLVLASWNQVLDPWIYLLFRHEMLKRFAHLIAKSRGGSALRRLVSFKGSCRSTSSGSETTHDTQSRQVQMDSFVGEELSSKM
ncbi:thromboxane A2 receptor-like [Mytilus californianus]|uniref:thromboxane A2 receptor-like n=1 Tax=Mytilus californianus TaxID=6549 RepID=UPI0022460261|nr:thromboxane A2 receptor-like [Mytilus californianus]